ncbi:MAG: rRNA maturation RNase YbeY [Candidatus Blackburnbacteria bacterium RIFCSPHIGHO2_01_FULL_43_15b]|uniref:rRNA maturation RNase YbeY n=1 Tax=Candidatus Blackburnbacteria bacterium RIFCSPHIGHO2_01_FULL_43_15b TaxID=1797513 RepID=A0A1G1UYN0_9BACT|nr:MAG: rRNA maturation RNase YbeY [Candidatus Blackburnbacteria bacterium RIFCSPHIGHO2_01_FULL_43_15b]
MISIFITRQSRYPTDTKALKEKLSEFLSGHGVTEAEVSVALVGERKMRELGEKFLNESQADETHEVLSFPASETGGDFPKDPNDKKFLSEKNFFNSLRSYKSLGDIAICYPEVRKIAIKKNRLMDEVIQELALHGALHLLGIHHPE